MSRYMSLRVYPTWSLLSSVFSYWLDRFWVWGFGGLQTRSGLPRWLGEWRAHLQCGSGSWHRADPWAGKVPWRRAGQPSPVFWLGESLDRGTTVHGVSELDMTEVTRGTHAHKPILPSPVGAKLWFSQLWDDPFSRWLLSWGEGARNRSS